MFGRRTCFPAVVATTLAALFCRTPAFAQPRVGDCNGDRLVGLAELVVGINVALGLLPLNACLPLDADGDGRASIAELVAAVGASFRPTLATSGTCLQPRSAGGVGGRPDGLEACSQGMLVTVSRCDDRSGCLSGGGGFTVLGFGRVGTNGSFSLLIDMEEATDAALVFEAEVEPATGTTYRTLAFGPASLPGAGGGAQTLEGVLLSPVSEAAVQLLDENGLEQFDDAGVADVNGAVAAANAGTDFSGQTLSGGVDTALDTARQNPVVQDVITTRRTPAGTSTPTPTSTPTITPTSTSTATGTPTPTGAMIVVFARPVGAAVRAAASAGLILLPASNLRTVTVTLLGAPADDEIPVEISSSNPDVAALFGAAVIAPGSRSVTFDVRTGEPGSAILQLRAGGTVRDLDVTVGEPVEVPAVTARVVGASVRAPLSAGQIITAAEAQRTVTFSFLSTPPGSDLPVIVTSSDPNVVDVIGTPMVPAGTTDVTLEIQTGTPGSATLRLRAGDTVRDLEVVAGEPVEVPAVTAPIVGVLTIQLK